MVVFVNNFSNVSDHSGGSALQELLKVEPINKYFENVISSVTFDNISCSDILW